MTKSVRQLKHLLLLAAPAILFWGCSNPADNVQRATVSSTNGTAKAAAPASTKPQTAYVISPNDSSIEFVGSKVTGSHTGRFSKFDGEIAVVDGHIADTGNKIIISMDSISADAGPMSDRLTGHLKSPDFFNVAQIPNATFETSAVTATPTNTLVTGSLTLHGVTKVISFPAEVHVAPDNVTLLSEFVINRFDFDIKFPGKPDDLIRKEVVLKLKVKAPKKA